MLTQPSAVELTQGQIQILKHKESENVKHEETFTGISKDMDNS